MGLIPAMKSLCVTSDRGNALHSLAGLNRALSDGVSTVPQRLCQLGHLAGLRGCVVFLVRERLLSGFERFFFAVIRTDP